MFERAAHCRPGIDLAAFVLKTLHGTKRQPQREGRVGIGAAAERGEASRRQIEKIVTANLPGLELQIELV